jgi:hypothetical protein
MKIKIVQYYYSNNLEYVKQSEEINSDYCKKYDLEYYCETSSEKIFQTCNDRNPSWFKIKLLLEHLNTSDCDYIAYMDADAFIVNHDKDFRDILSQYPEHDLIIGADFGPDLVNGGVLIFKNTDWSKDFLKRVWEKSEVIARGAYKRESWLEQTILSTFLTVNDSDNAKAKILHYDIDDSINSLQMNGRAFIYHDISKTRVSEFYKLKYGDGGDVFTHLKLITTSDRHVGHGYFNYYIPLIEKYNKAGLTPTILDIGSGDNGLTFKCLVETTDLKINYICLSNTENICPNVKLYNYSAVSEEDVDNFLNENKDELDIIIDDNTHKSQERHFLFYKLFPHLKSGGMYIVEDLQTDYEITIPSANERWGWGDPNKKSFVNMLNEFNELGTFTSDYYDFSYGKDDIKYTKIKNTMNSSELGLVKKL